MKNLDLSPLTPAALAPVQEKALVKAATNELKEDMVAALLEAWEKGGRKKFLAQCKERFDTDAIKLVKDIYLPLMPKESQQMNKTERCAVRIEYNPERMKSVEAIVITENQ